MRYSGLAGLVATLLICLVGRVTAQETAAEILAQSNNPLAPSAASASTSTTPRALWHPGVSNIQHQGVLIPFRRHFDLFHIIRATLPVSTVPADSGTTNRGWVTW
jgi:hypothetical protein